MLILPPPSPPVPEVERSRTDRRARTRRKRAIETDAEHPPTPEPAARMAADEPVVERMKPRSRGRRKTDREEIGVSQADASTSRRSRPHAPLVAQLIATALGVEQTRVRRRGTVDEAAALYGRKPDRPKRSRGEA